MAGREKKRKKRREESRNSDRIRASEIDSTRNMEGKLIYKKVNFMTGKRRRKTDKCSWKR